MKTLLATTTALLVAAASPAFAGEDMDGDDKMKTTVQTTMDGKKMMSGETMDGDYKVKTMDVGMQNKTMTKTTTAMNAPQNDLFGQIDVDASGDVDFTEFSNYMETKGYSATDSAKEYVKLTSGSNGVVTDRSFAGVDIINLPHKHLDDGAVHNMGTTQTAATVTTVQPTAVMSRTVTASPMTSTPMMRAEYGTFTDYDMDSDGRVNFAEYSKARRKAGITTTAAAQEFIRYTDGGQDFDESRFQIAVSEDVLNRSYFRAQTTGYSNYDDPSNNVVFDATDYDLED